MLYERIIAAAVNTPWAIEPMKLRLIESFLARKGRGEAIPQYEIEAAKSSQRKSQPTPPGGVGLVPIYGTITQRADLFTEWSGGTSTEKVGAQIDALAADPNVKAIVLDVDSPGGSVYGVAELADKIRAVAKDKKVIGVANSEAASAAYWLLSQASEVVVTPSGQVGSIGVYVLHINQAEAMKQAGREATFISAGERKVAGNSYGPLDQLGREELQKSVNDYYSMFTSAVARGRGRQQATVQKGFGKGGMVRAEEAVSEGMADKVGTLESVLSRYGLSLSDASPAASSQRDYYSEHSASDDQTAIEIRKRKLLLNAPFKAAAFESRLASALAPRTMRGPLVQPPTRDPRLWATALHEAGHGVAAVAMGIPFANISARPDATAGGRLNWRNDGDSKLAHDEAVAVMLFAGPAGEALNELARGPCYLSDNDRRCLWLRCPDETKQQRARDSALAFVKNHTPAIRLVASKLIVAPTRTLSSEQVEALCREAGLSC